MTDSKRGILLEVLHLAGGSPFTAGFCSSIELFRFSSGLNLQYTWTGTGLVVNSEEIQRRLGMFSTAFPPTYILNPTETSVQSSLDSCFGSAFGRPYLDLSGNSSRAISADFCSSSDSIFFHSTTAPGAFASEMMDGMLQRCVVLKTVGFGESLTYSR